MFKKISHRLILALPAILTLGCRTAPPLPQVDLSEPGWKVLQGQAVWRRQSDAPEIAGDILLARNTGGHSLVQFTKTPFPLVIAQITTNGWQIEAPVDDRRFSGRGAPPARVIWFQLPGALSGSTIPPRWNWTTHDAGWRLENPSTGERLEGYFGTNSP